MHVLDFKVIVDAEHEDFSNGINTFEDRQIPTTIEAERTSQMNRDT